MFPLGQTLNSKQSAENELRSETANEIWLPKRVRALTRAWRRNVRNYLVVRRICLPRGLRKIGWRKNGCGLTVKQLPRSLLTRTYPRHPPQLRRPLIQQHLKAPARKHPLHVHRLQTQRPPKQPRKAPACKHPPQMEPYRAQHTKVFSL